MKDQANSLPVYVYAKKHNINLQTLYRWIREGKIKTSATTLKERVVSRLEIIDIPLEEILDK